LGCLYLQIVALLYAVGRKLRLAPFTSSYKTILVTLETCDVLQNSLQHCAPLTRLATKQSQLASERVSRCPMDGFQATRRSCRWSRPPPCETAVAHGERSFEVVGLDVRGKTSMPAIVAVARRKLGSVELTNAAEGSCAPFFVNADRAVRAKLTSGEVWPESRTPRWLCERARNRHTSSGAHTLVRRRDDFGACEWRPRRSWREMQRKL
jgi:hypothetical protein